MNGRMNDHHRAILDLAQAQHGVITRRQALEAGMSGHAVDGLLARGAWEVVFRGAFRMVGTRRTFDQTLIAACLAAGPGAVASHRSAAYLHGLAGLARWVEVTVPPTRQPRIRNVLVHRSSLDPGDRRDLRGIPATSAARTLIDLAGTLSGERLERVLDHALAHRVVGRAELAGGLDRLGRAGRRGAGALAALLDDRPETSRPIGSEFEADLFRAVRAAGLPEPMPQFRVTLQSGGERFLDFAYPEVKLAIEADSYTWHAARRSWEEDRERNNDLVALGWSFLPLTWSAARYDPAGVARKVRDSLKTRRAG